MADTADVTTMDKPASVNLEPLLVDVPGYGYVLLVVFCTWFLLFWQGFMVGRMRKKYKVDYPAMYSDTEQVFNCYQVSAADILKYLTCSK